MGAVSIGTRCDSCHATPAPGAGFLLSNAQVVVSEAYWVRSFQLSHQMAELLLDRDQQEQYFHNRLTARAADHTPWRICDDCTELFLADWARARSHLRHGTRPPDTPVKPADFVLPAARAWERVFGWWPGVVARPEPADACDLCDRPVSDAERAAFLKATLLAGWRRDAVLAADPLRPARPGGRGGPGWLACGPCCARLFARLYRLRAARGAQVGGATR